MVAFKSALLLLALGTEALAASDVVCQSKLGTASIPANKIPRATTTVKNKITIIKKVIRKINVVVVPLPRTTTETETIEEKTTVVADPDVETAVETVSDWQTKYETHYHTVYSSATSYTTTTKYTSETIAAPAGFTGLREAGDYRAKIKARAAPAAPANPAVLPAGLRSGSEYVQRVDCVKNVPSRSTKVVTSTVKGPRITLKAKTKTKSVKSTTTIIETEYPPKVTQTSTETVYPTLTQYVDRTETIFNTETVTVETIVPTGSPYYAACADTNMVSQANGAQRVQDVQRSVGNRGASVQGPQNSYECCAECMKSPSCAMSLWITGSAASCWLYTITDTGLCGNGQLAWGSYFTRPTSTSPWTFSNGPCGKLGNGGSRG
ncbi:hypothetical protein F66182_10469 [Fusarium sp. NRRL 66182]|nr:hypothetical protein F66182_10469 [Fusarium sp. NRRL 66182]